MTTEAITEPLELFNLGFDTHPAGKSATARQETMRQRLERRAGTRSHDDLPHRCHCAARWSGASTAHCAACHRTFSGPSTFDVHRVDFTCVDPADIGLTLAAGRAYECWGTVLADEIDPKESATMPDQILLCHCGAQLAVREPYGASLLHHQDGSHTLMRPLACEPLITDERTLNAPIRPASSDPDFGLGLPGYAIGYRDERTS